MYIYLNDQIIDSKEAKISVFDHGYLYGVGLFETFAIYDGHPFLLDDHFLRLQEGLKQIGIDWFMEKEEAVSILQQLLKANRLKDAYVRWNVSAGPQEVGLFAGVYKEPTLTVLIKPLPAKRTIPKKVEILALRRNTPEGRVRLKSHHYLNNLLAKREMVHNSPDVEGVFLTEEGYVAEGLVSNLFWVKNGQVYTPSVATGILNGVTRQFVITLLRKANLKVEEGLYQLHELEAADEIFMTNSIQELVPLILEDNQIDDSRVFELLDREYQLSKQKKLWSRYKL
ncbi:4-amino-4-deoxychorismate lyase [Alkalihalobacillus alcalophilus ATCC 27647 = CGMCC 1.3604]|uniref:4-amino-4-deoxychorismate lyase n=1 Tax=Alkalihalobacillus alcalophilus ATCC 27647 = CGMCC 1.3604 TaxID=1218173 RepID=A0A094WF00_ALKAL|nr:aminodeoxychorismate lyase [Alkalihalobacillus alcalophilus]KGA96319.1 4-amino-4-deoxychorismate lyase [Alkalihalobacillus alcalophilus ATCC 27647 = CGMCC 1.3604]MED1561717.1 aminodeoxychorismate lyase [Alkalihalobacillus alcalophilus]THG92398.1 4-amino-4-deoxychorismate lyase [Alkalihalobacillus alcalophilus ATCC 27647 = CGMCC 1.3604]